MLPTCMKLQNKSDNDAEYWHPVDESVFEEDTDFGLSYSCSNFFKITPHQNTLVQENKCPFYIGRMLKTILVALKYQNMECHADSQKSEVNTNYLIIYLYFTRRKIVF